MKTIILTTGVKIQQDFNDNIVTVYSPYMNFEIYNLSISKNMSWSPFIKHVL